LKGVARYEVFNYRRTKARDRLVFDEDIIQLLADECQEEFAKGEQERRALDGCLKKLPAHQRELVLRVYSAGQKIKPSPTGKRQRRRCRRRVRRRYCVEQRAADRLSAFAGFGKQQPGAMSVSALDRR
jgi:hypothetical protein